MTDEVSLRRRIENLTGRPPSRRLAILTDTTEFMGIDRGHVLRLEGREYLVMGDMKEGRFGLDEDPKFWVKKALDLETGGEKVLKLVFHEEFRVRLGLLSFRCRRDPAKEARVLEATRGDERFMQGHTRKDEAGNLVRVVDYIRGPNLYELIRRRDGDHECYVRTALPALLTRLVPAIRAIGDLHAAGFHHGDIRNDHLLVDSETGRFRWIDFDLMQDVSDFDVWSLGNVLLLVIGAGEHTFRDVTAGRVAAAGPDVTFGAEDASAFFAHRVMNLKKLFPWLPDDLADILMHFSWGTKRFYEDVDGILADLEPAIDGLREAVGADS